MAAVLLPAHLQDLLQRSGESGMGYQTGNVTLKSGQVVRDVLFMNHHVQGVRGHAKGEIPFSADDIQSIELTHNRWKWEW